MELYTVKKEQLNGKSNSLVLSTSSIAISPNVNNITDSKFIAANTHPITLQEIKNRHTIPVYVKDNVPAISQVEFIESTMDIAKSTLKKPLANLAIRVSHPIKGRTFEARNKRVKDLLEQEKTIYNERLVFVFEIPYFKQNLLGQDLTLTVAGVKAYNHDNLYSYGGSIQRFKIGIGYKVQVCTNLCLFTDGTQLEIKARNVEELQIAILELFQSQSFFKLIPALKKLGNYDLTERQFATLLGRARLYNHLPKKLKNSIPPLLISDTQTSTVAKEYYRSKSFKRNPDGSINLWNLFNLFTDAVKSSYIDSFLDRNVNAFQFSTGIADVLDKKGNYHWFMS